MSRFRAVFAGRRHVVLPVIHTVHLAQVLGNVDIVREAGTDGAFLISHGQVSDEELLDVYLEVKQRVPGFWIGANFLSWSLPEVFSRAGDGVAGIWSDDALIDETQQEQPAASGLRQVQQEHGWRGLHFGGVAFKYQRPVRDLAAAARLAVPYVDVVTTSGPGTGRAADPAKIRTMKQAIGDFPLAIASGVTPENVNDYLDWADCFLVATGISLTFEEIDPERVRDLIRVVRDWQPPSPAQA